MASTQDINYALISALYANESVGLYSDVYFPIIKYTIVQLFIQNNSADNSHYYTSKDVHDYIDDRFKINIPTIVISKSILKIKETKKNFIDLETMEEGDIFQIKRLWNSPEFDRLAEREESFSEGLTNLEKDYQEYLEKNGIYDDGITFQQFISDNTEEVLGYFQNSDISTIDERYTTIIFFLEYLHNTPSKRNEFHIADQLFWASIIAGFLMSEKPLIDAAEDGSIKEYYLDTSILLGMLKLSTDKKEKYSAEIIEIIKASGGAMKVHPMTIEEIKNILLSVESATQPLPGTDIAEAWERDNLSVNKLAGIRVRLQEKLELMGVQMFPVMGANKCREIKQKYRGKKIVEELARLRSNNPTSYSQDNFREIHDIFMDDYIKERREKKSVPEDVVFVTYNKDLISFNKERHPGTNYMMSTGQLVLDLWMHSAKPANISGCALTETMARCLDQHNVRVRNKIAEVSRFFNENRGNFDALVYQDFIKKLYQRARNVINVVEADPDEQGNWGPEINQRIIDAVKADNEYLDKRITESEAKRIAIEEQLKSEKEKIMEQSRMRDEHIEELKKENTDLSSRMAEAQQTLSEKEKLLEKETSEKEAAKKKNDLYQERDVLKNRLREIVSELEPLESLRNKSFINYEQWVWLIIAIFLILGAIGVVLYGVVNNNSILAAGAVPATLGIFCLTRFIGLKEKVDERREKAFKEWEEKQDNKHYQELNIKKIQIEGRLTTIEESLKL